MEARFFIEIASRPRSLSGIRAKNDFGLRGMPPRPPSSGVGDCRITKSSSRAVPFWYLIDFMADLGESLLKGGLQAGNCLGLPS